MVLGCGFFRIEGNEKMDLHKHRFILRDVGGSVGLGDGRKSSGVAEVEFESGDQSCWW